MKSNFEMNHKLYRKAAIFATGWCIAEIGYVLQGRVRVEREAAGLCHYAESYHWRFEAAEKTKK